MPVERVAATLGQRGAGVNRRHYQPTNAEERRVGDAVVKSLARGARWKLERDFEFPKGQTVSLLGGESRMISSCARGDSNLAETTNQREESRGLAVVSVS